MSSRKTEKEEMDSDTTNDEQSSLSSTIHHSRSDHGLCERITRIARSIIDPHKHVYRYMLLLLFCLARVCLAFSVDMPAALESTIINVMRVDITQYELLYSLFAWPNVFLAVVGGVLIDRVFGLRLGLLLFVTIACIGQLLVAMGGFFNQFWLMVIGRFVFGAGVDLSGSAGDIFAAALFRDSELSFVFGLVYGAGRISATLSLNFSDRLYNIFRFVNNRNARLGCVLLVGFALCLVALMLAVVGTALDYRREKAVGHKREKRGQFKLKDLKDFRVSFWLFVGIGFLYYIPVFPFLSIGQVFFKQKYEYSVSIANTVNGITFLVPAVSYPLFGLLCDWTGYKLYWGMFSVLGTQAVHFLFAYAGQEFFLPIINTLSLGLFYSIFTSAVWPLVFLLIPEHQLGTAYGISYAFYSLGQALSAIIVGQIIDNIGYMMVEIFFVSVLSLTLLLLVAFYFTTDGQNLNISGRLRRKQKKLENKVIAEPQEDDNIHLLDSDELDADRKGEKTSHESPL